MKKIEYPKLKKIGGFKNLILKILVKVAIIVLISSALGWFSGHTIQKSFSNLTGYNKTVTEAIQPAEEADGEVAQESDNPYVRALSNSLNATSNVIKAIAESEVMQKANKASVDLALTAIKPLTDLINILLRILWLAAFWVPFSLIFIITAWLTSKLINAKRSLTDGTDPQVIKNMEMLEAKVKELVDNANGDVA
ncbi:hypothetical protein KAR91_33595 [Candidatus Pacearchaeota archaeon]|nr:hypothetical protein [Candidatus Pacearchaeota archaeon]